MPCRDLFLYSYLFHFESILFREQYCLWISILSIYFTEDRRHILYQMSTEPDNPILLPHGSQPQQPDPSFLQILERGESNKTLI